MDFQTPYSNNIVINFILTTCRNFYVEILFLLIFNLYIAIALSIRPYIIKKILNNIEQYDNGYLNFAVLLPIFIYLFIVLLNVSIMRLSDYVYNIKLAPRIISLLSNQMIKYTLFSEDTFLIYAKRESLTESITDIITMVPEVINICINRFFYLAISVLVGISVLLFVGKIFAMILFLWVLLVSFVLFLASAKILALSQNASAAFSEVKHNIFDVLTNFISVSTAKSHFLENQNLDSMVSKFISLQEKSSLSHFLMWATYGYSFFIMLCLNFLFLVKNRYLGYNISVGDFALVITVNVIIFDIFWTVFRDSLSLVTYISKIGIGFKNIASLSSASKESMMDEISITPTKIQFKNISFKIDEKYILKNINISISLGKKILISGKSGSGKSSFVNLIAGLVKPTEGSISKLSDKSICLISNDNFLFDRSIYHNIAYPSTEVEIKDIHNAAKLAHAHDFIIKLEEGYNTKLSKNKIKLSSGQIQRILLARAILKNSDITILDEATSHLDKYTEKQIFDNIIKIFHDKTLIIINHRVSNIALFDSVIEIENGQIITNTEKKLPKIR